MKKMTLMKIVIWLELVLFAGAFHYAIGTNFEIGRTAMTVVAIAIYGIFGIAMPLLIIGGMKTSKEDDEVDGIISVKELVVFLVCGIFAVVLYFIGWIWLNFGLGIMIVLIYDVAYLLPRTILKKDNTGVLLGFLIFLLLAGFVQIVITNLTKGVNELILVKDIEETAVYIIVALLIPRRLLCKEKKEQT